MMLFVAAVCVLLLILCAHLVSQVSASRSQLTRALALLEELLKCEQVRQAKHERVKAILTSEEERAKLRARVAARLGKAGA